MTLNAHEAFCLNTATSFSAVRGRGANRTREDFKSLEAAQAYATTFGDKRTMVYAVNDMGNNAHVGNF